MSPTDHQAPPPVPGFPRVSGDEPVILEAATRDAEFSPRERG